MFLQETIFDRVVYTRNLDFDEVSRLQQSILAFINHVNFPEYNMVPYLSDEIMKITNKTILSEILNGFHNNSTITIWKYISPSFCYKVYTGGRPVRFEYTSDAERSFSGY